MNRITIIHNPFEPENNTVADVDNICDYLLSEFDMFPEHGKIYHKSVSVDCDITDKVNKDGAIDESFLESLDGDIFIVIYPSADPFTIASIVLSALSALASVYMYLTMPKPQQAVAQSPNNELSDRVNKTRLNGRVPEIFGQVRSTPDLISNPILYYRDDGIEVEDCLYVVSKGYLQIDDMRDGDTYASTIPEFQASIYNPNTSLLSTPLAEVGESFADLPLVGRRSEAITGQTLSDYNSAVINNETSGTAYAQYPNRIYFTAGGLDSLFDVGDSVTVESETVGVQDEPLSGSAIVDPLGAITIETTQDIANPSNFKWIQINTLLVNDTVNGLVDLAGVYDILTISKTAGYVYTIVLSDFLQTNQNWSLLSGQIEANCSAYLTANTQSINISGEYSNIIAVNPNYISLEIPPELQAEWNKLNGVAVTPTSIDLLKPTDNFLGWFYIEQKDIEVLIFNLTFPKGLFSVGTNGRNYEYNVNYEINYQELVDGSPSGEIFTSTYQLWGLRQTEFGESRRFNLATNFAEGVRIRIRKLPDVYVASKISRTNEIKIKSVYACARAPEYIMNDVTVARTRTVATTGALSVKERRFNCLVTRRLPNNGAGLLATTKSGAQALIYLALDSKNGRRSLNEVDITQIVAEEQKIIDYFGSNIMSEFSYTLDDSNLSFEEIAGMIASSMFCEAYRFGNKLRIRFEKPESDSIILFNHTNKVPYSEKRTKRFGIDNNYDGVELEYTNPDDDTRITYVASDSSNPISLMNIKTTGIRSNEQAKTRAWREWNKLVYQNTTVEFEALDESELLTRNDRILVSDNTMSQTIDGYVLDVDGFVLYLSQDVPSDETSYTIYVQLPDASVDMILCERINSESVLLSRAPTINLAEDRASYQLVKSGNTKSNAFLVTEIRPQTKMTNALKCINYDDRYYDNDLDFV